MLLNVLFWSLQVFSTIATYFRCCFNILNEYKCNGWHVFVKKPLIVFLFFYPFILLLFTERRRKKHQSHPCGDSVNKRHWTMALDDDLIGSIANQSVSTNFYWFTFDNTRCQCYIWKSFKIRYKSHFYWICETCKINYGLSIHCACIS